MDVRFSTDPKGFRAMTTEELRTSFLIDRLFVPDESCRRDEAGGLVQASAGHGGQALLVQLRQFDHLPGLRGDDLQGAGRQLLVAVAAAGNAGLRPAIFDIRYSIFDLSFAS